MKVSVAICTWNRSGLLRRTLEQMCRLVVPPDVEWELILVDNNSTDDTRQVVAEFINRLPIRYVFEPKQGLSHARNRAVQEAQGEYILWTDDDVLVDEEWMQAYVEGFRKYPEAAFFGGPVEAWFEGEPPEWLIRTLSLVEHAFAIRHLGDEECALPRGEDGLPYGANYCLRSDWQKRFVYDTVLGVAGKMRKLGEETVLLREVVSAGGEGRWLPRARVRHWIPQSRQTLKFLRQYYFGGGRTSCLLEKETLLAPGQKIWFGVPRWTWRALVENTVRYVYYRATKPPEVWVPALVKMSRTWGYWYECRRQWKEWRRNG